MEPNILQSLVGSLSFGLQATDAVASLTAPAGELKQPVICMIGSDGTEHIVFDGSADGMAVSAADSNDYHVLHVLGGHVYFGRLRVHPQMRTVGLDDAHYLVKSHSHKASLQLIRVSQEMHAPNGEITLNMTYVVSWQKLSAQSALMAAICNGRVLYDNKR